MATATVALDQNASMEGVRLERLQLNRPETGGTKPARPNLELGVLVSIPSRLAVFVLLFALSFFSAARAETSDVETAWRLLDYIAVDYAGAVSHGTVSSPSEYAEQNEFAATVAAKLATLPPKPERQRLVTEAARLQRAIADKAAAEQVAGIAHGLAAALLAAYPVPLAPNKLPDFAGGKMLFAQHCAVCHGEAGDGHGPDAAKLDTPPIAFTDADRARKRSVFALYQVITQGLDGTAMPSFDSLPTDERSTPAISPSRTPLRPRGIGCGNRMLRFTSSFPI
jgi:high-affinity iron transporter